MNEHPKPVAVKNLSQDGQITIYSVLLYLVLVQSTNTDSIWNLDPPAVTYVVQDLHTPVVEQIQSRKHMLQQ